MNPAKALVVLMSLAAAAGHPLAAEAFVPYRELRQDGAYVDWLDGHAAVTGRAVSFRDLTMKIFFMQAKELAQENGRARLLSFLRQLPIDDRRHLGDDPDLFEKLKKQVGSAEASNVEVAANSTLKVLVKVPLHGDQGIMSLIAPPPAGAIPASAPAGVAAAVPAHTGLILDATLIPGASPSLLPRVVDEKGREVYGLDLVDASAARARGLAGFATRVETKEAKPPIAPREGANPLRTAAIGVSGAGKTVFVVSSADADMILKEASASPFLRDCRVLILMPPGGSPAPGSTSAHRPSPSRTPSRPRELEKPH